MQPVSRGPCPTSLNPNLNPDPNHGPRPNPTPAPTLTPSPTPTPNHPTPDQVSRGRVELDTTDPLAPPRLWPGFCEADDDVATLREGIRLSRRLAAAEAFEWL